MNIHSTGRSWGPYLLEEQIGSSRWGAVYRRVQADDESNGALTQQSHRIAAIPGRATIIEGCNATAQITHRNRRDVRGRLRGRIIIVRWTKIERAGHCAISDRTITSTNIGSARRWSYFACI